MHDQSFSAAAIRLTALMADALFPASLFACGDVIVSQSKFRDSFQCSGLVYTITPVAFMSRHWDTVRSTACRRSFMLCQSDCVVHACSVCSVAVVVARACVCVCQCILCMHACARRSCVPCMLCCY